MNNLSVFILIGFLAQLIDGSLGMGYKTSSTAFLLSVGVPPLIASASVHTGGIFTSAVSGFSHFKFGNANRDMLWRLAFPGIIGGIIGAILLTHLPGELIKPVVAVYLFLMGIRIVYKAWRHATPTLEDALRKTDEMPALGRQIARLGFVGGFFDAIGGGGWGPIVTSTLVMNGHPPRFVIGTVNIAEFFVTVAQAAAFITLIGHDYEWGVVLGLIIGGVAAAPLAAYVCRILPADRLMGLVGILILLLSSRTLLTAIGG